MSKGQKVLFFLAIGLYSAISANGQFARPPIGSLGGTSRPVVSRPTVIRTTSVVTKVVVKTTVKTEKVKISNLSVTTEPGAKVTFELAAKGAKPTKVENVADDMGIVIFDDLKPGIYHLVAAKDGFETKEADNVTISPQKAHGLDMQLKVFTYKLRIKTNLAAGKIFFAPAKEMGKDSSGAIISEQLGNYCVVPIQKNGEATITDLKKGYYDIDIQPDSLEFEQKATGIHLPEDLDLADGTGPGEIKTFPVDLAKNQSKEEFSTSWIAADWMMPSNWKLDRGMKVKNVEGVALPQNERYRYYVNFEMLANVKLNDDGTVGFALRARDQKNYYLLQISGNKADDANTAVLYSVINGQSKLIKSQTLLNFATTVSSDKGFGLKVHGDDTGFTVWIEDSNTGKVNPVGIFKDPLNTYQKGAMGIAALPKSNFDIRFFQVCTPVCP